MLQNALHGRMERDTDRERERERFPEAKQHGLERKRYIVRVRNIGKNLNEDIIQMIRRKKKTLAHEHPHSLSTCIFDQPNNSFLPGSALCINDITLLCNAGKCSYAVVKNFSNDKCCKGLYQYYLPSLFCIATALSSSVRLSPLKPLLF